MKTLDTQNYLDAYKALDRFKNPSRSISLEHVALSAILTVSIEWGKGINQIQEILDTKANEMLKELSDLTASIAE